MHALPAAPAPPPRRQVFVGTALAGVRRDDAHRRDARRLAPARERALDAGEHVAAGGDHDPRGAGQHHADRLLGCCVFAQWARVRRPAQRPGPHRPGPRPRRPDRPRRHQRPGVRLRPDGAADRRRDRLPGMFYAVTGTISPCSSSGSCSPSSPRSASSAVARPTGRSSPPTPCTGTSSPPSFSAVWFVVYVTK